MYGTSPSRSLSLCIYIYIHTHIHINCMYACYLYIYIYTHMHICGTKDSADLPPESPGAGTRLAGVFVSTGASPIEVEPVA